jgi:competence protein ComEA
MAERIVAARPIESLSDLDQIPGVGPKTLEKLKPVLTLPDSGATTYTAKPVITTVVDLNSATLSQLQTLPGIGPKMAQRIIDERSKHPFQAVDDLRRVPGIGPKTLDKLRPWVTVR